MPPPPIVRTVEVPPAVPAFAAFLKENGISDRAAASALEVSHPTVIAWRTGEKIPGDENRERIELYCAIPDAETGQPVKDERGQWVSRVPRDWWRLGGDERAPVQPFAVAREAATSPEAP